MTFSQLDAATAEAVAEAMQALATPSRVRLLARLCDGPCSVGELAASRDELKAKLLAITDPDERFEWTQLLADSALAAGVSAQIDRAYLALLD